MILRISTLVILAIISAAFGATAQTSEFDATLAAARKGDYQAQRNLAYMLEHGDGVAQNFVEGCAWRFAVIATQGAAFGDSDVTIDERCGGDALKAAALARTQALLSALSPSLRTIDADLATLTDGDCPGAACKGASKTFAGAYRAALKGDVAAMRFVASCFAAGCEARLSVDFFKACLWATRLSAMTPVADRESKILSTTTCGNLGPIAATSIKPHSAMLDALRAVEAASGQTSRGKRGL